MDALRVHMEELTFRWGREAGGLVSLSPDACRFADAVTQIEGFPSGGFSF